MYKLYFKFIIDFVIALILLIALSPGIIITIIGLFIVNHGEPFFFQKRPGINEQLFNIIKFKTMNDKKDSNGNLLSDEQRLTKIGKIFS